MGQLLLRVLSRYRQTVLTEAEKRGFGDLRSPHLHVLAHLGAGIRLTDLAMRAQLSLAAASEFVSDLERLGYVERRRDLADGRARLIVPTARGRKALKEGAKVASAIEQRWALLVDDERLAQAFEVLQQLVNRLEGSERLPDQTPERRESATVA